MKTNSSLNRILILLIILFISIFWVYYSGFVDIKTKSQNISQMEVTLNNTMRQNQYMNALSHDVAGADSAITRINSLILANENDVGFIEKLEQTAKNNGLDIKIDSLAVEDLPPQKNGKLSVDLTTLKIKATTSGSWQKTYTFLSQLESLPFVIRVDKIALINSSDNAIGQVKRGVQTWQTIFEIRVLKYK